MKDSSLETLNKELHSQAELLAKEYVDEFAASLLLQAKMLAFQENADMVLSNHVEEARQVIRRERKQRWARELLVVIGSALFGAFIPGFITELSAGISYSSRSTPQWASLECFCSSWDCDDKWGSTCLYPSCSAKLPPHSEHILSTIGNR